MPAEEHVPFAVWTDKVLQPGGRRPRRRVVVRVEGYGAAFALRPDHARRLAEELLRVVAEIEQRA